MTLRSPAIPPRLMEGSLTQNEIRAAEPVRGAGQWYEMALATNWVAGRGAMLATIGPDQQTAVAPGSSRTYRMYVYPRAVNVTWLCCAEIETNGSGGAHGTITLGPGGTAYDWTIPGSDIAGESHATLQFPYDPSSVVTGEVTAVLAVDSDSTDSARINSLTLHELPRVVHDSATATVGVHETSCMRGQVINENTTTQDKYSVQGVWQQVSDASSASRRCALFHWHDTSGITTVASTFSGTSNVFYLDPTIQTRHMSPSTTTRTVAWAVRALVTGTSAVGEVKVTMASGATSTITITNTSEQWTSGSGFVIETDDFSQTAAIRGGTASRDTATFEIRKTAGTSITLYAISVGEG